MTFIENRMINTHCLTLVLYGYLWLRFFSSFMNVKGALLTLVVNVTVDSA